MRTEINLATRPRVNQRTFWVFGTLFALATLVFTGFVAREGSRTWNLRMTTRGQLSEMRAERDQLRDDIRRMTADLENPSTQQLLEQMHFLNQMIRQKRFSWGVFFERVAGHLPGKARLLAISPTLGEGGRVNVNIRVGGKSASEIHEFMRALEEADHFSQVILLSEDHDDDDLDPVQARISTVYREGN